ncbi:hypothetical protein CASFOL_028410 [Castilleja foliolosa]|uniref:Uncharacterized protein n=2 Tax=Castilleja foliolosa TaxID=1961234 RepID=A0ABD3CEA7_9LAMI
MRTIGSSCGGRARSFGHDRMERLFETSSSKRKCNFTNMRKRIGGLPVSKKKSRKLFPFVPIEDLYLPELMSPLDSKPAEFNLIVDIHY